MCIYYIYVYMHTSCLCMSHFCMFSSLDSDWVYHSSDSQVRSAKHLKGGL